MLMVNELITIVCEQPNYKYLRNFLELDALSRSVINYLMGEIILCLEWVLGNTVH